MIVYSVMHIHIHVLKVRVYTCTKGHVQCMIVHSVMYIPICNTLRLNNKLFYKAKTLNSSRNVTTYTYMYIQNTNNTQKNNDE